MFCSVSLCAHECVCVCVSVGGEMEAVIHPHFGIQFETEIFLGRGAGWRSGFMNPGVNFLYLLIMSSPLLTSKTKPWKLARLTHTAPKATA